MRIPDLSRIALALATAVVVPACAGTHPITSPTGWTWLGGAASVQVNGTYGTRGVPAPANTPGGRSTGLLQVDAAGGVLVYAGAGMGASGTWGYLNDLWRFDGFRWTWLSGSTATGQGGVYGTKGLAASTNIPGGRIQMAGALDAAGNLWVFGGMAMDSVGGFEHINDLWKWDGTNWTWVSGSKFVAQSGNYGTQGVAAASNIPGGRALCNLWFDPSGNLWIFGGLGYDSAGGSLKDLNDLWRFDGTNWTWMAGSTLGDQAGTYGTQGTPSAANTPGARATACGARHGGSFWLFGGGGKDCVGATGWLNDLWKWDGAAWTWVSGSNIANPYGASVGQGIPDAANVPSCRTSGALWADSSGQLWLFGGLGVDLLGTASGRLNDLWKWDGTYWTWVRGSNGVDAPGRFGVQGLAAIDNDPASGDGPLYGSDLQGRPLLFGGWGPSTSVPGYMNDLWRYEP